MGELKASRQVGEGNLGAGEQKSISEYPAQLALGIMSLTLPFHL